MKPIKFKGSNIVFAKDQPEYLPLPAWRKPNDSQGVVVSCWKATFKERLKILFTGRLYLSLLTFNKPLTPNRIYAENPIQYFIKEDKNEK